MAERKDMRRKFRKEQEGSISEAELQKQLDVAMLMKALQWRRNEHQIEKSSRVGLDKSSIDKAIPLSVAGTKGDENAADPKHAEQALLLQFACSLTDRENMGIHHDVVKANPGLSEKELSAVKRAVMIAKAHAWKGRLDE
jgi:hypothetical protein